MDLLTAAWEAWGEKPIARCQVYTPEYLRVERLVDNGTGVAYWIFGGFVLAVGSRIGLFPTLALRVLVGSFVFLCGLHHLVRAATAYDVSLLPLANGVGLCMLAVSWGACVAGFNAWRSGRLRVDRTRLMVAADEATRSFLIYATLVAAAALVGLVGAWGYSAIAALMSQAHQRRDEGLANRAFREAIHRVRQAESAQRGFLLRGAPAHLVTYRSRASSARSLLEKSTPSPVWSKAEFASLLSDASAKLGEMDRTVWLAESGRRDEAIALFDTDRGRQLMDSIESRYESLASRALGLAAARFAHIERSGNAALVTIPAAGGLSVIAVAGSVAALLRQVRIQARATAQVEIAAADIRAEIAEKQAAQFQAAQLQDELARNAEVMDALSHDTRTPLNAIRQQADLACMYLATDLGRYRDKIVRCMEAIKTISDGARDMLDSMLDSARAERGMPNVLSFEVEPALSKVAATLQVLADPKAIGIAVRCPRGLVARTDRDMLNRILMNLVSNSIKYTRSGSITIAAGRSPDNLGVNVSVADTGKGIEPAMISKLFKDFAQADNPQRDPSRGFGMGLSNVRRLASRLGGTVGVQSEVGRGSTFTVFLPDYPAV